MPGCGYMPEDNINEHLYVHISKVLRGEILSGKFAENSVFPSENELTKRFNVTRMTIRNAVSILVREGLLIKQQGKRIRVSLSKIRFTTWNFRSFTDCMRAQNTEPISKVLSFKEVMIEDKAYYELTRVRGIQQGHSVQYLTKEVSCIRKDYFPSITDFDFTTASLYEVMRVKYNIYPSNGQSSLSAEICDPELSDLFGIDRGSAIIKAHQVIYDTLNRVIEIVDIYHSPYFEIKFSRDSLNS